MDKQISQEDKPQILNNYGHRHDFKDKGDYFICSCGRKKLKLKSSGIDNILIGKKKDGSKYSVRNDRHRYFFPHEWKKFIKSVEKNKKHEIFFLTTLHTGGRAMEIINLRAENFNFDRGTITFDTVKQRKAKRSFSAIGKTRTFFVSSIYLKEVKSYLNSIDAGKKDYLFLDKEDIPKDYENISNIEKKKYYRKTETAYSQLFKRKLKSVGIKDWRNFSLHNIRKTYGQWHRTYDIRTEEICYRLGHDMQTYFAHYGSSLIFSSQDKIEIRNILGDVK